MHWKGRYDYTADSFSQSPMRRSSFGRQAEPSTKLKNRYRYSCRCLSWTLKKGISPCSGLVAWKQKCCLSPSTSEAVQLWLDLSLVHGTVMSAANVGGQAAQAARTAKLSGPRHLREQPPYFARAKKAQKITEYRDTAPLTGLSGLFFKLFLFFIFARSHSFSKKFDKKQIINKVDHYTSTNPPRDEFWLYNLLLADFIWAWQLIFFAFRHFFLKIIAGMRNNKQPK